MSLDDVDADFDFDFTNDPLIEGTLINNLNTINNNNPTKEGQVYQHPVKPISAQTTDTLGPVENGTLILQGHVPLDQTRSNAIECCKELSEYTTTFVYVGERMSEFLMEVPKKWKTGSNGVYVWLNMADIRSNNDAEYVTISLSPIRNDTVNDEDAKVDPNDKSSSMVLFEGDSSVVQYNDIQFSTVFLPPKTSSFRIFMTVNGYPIHSKEESFPMGPNNMFAICGTISKHPKEYVVPTFPPGRSFASSFRFENTHTTTDAKIIDMFRVYRARLHEAIIGKNTSDASHLIHASITPYSRLPIAVVSHSFANGPFRPKYLKIHSVQFQTPSLTNTLFVMCVGVCYLQKPGQMAFRFLQRMDTGLQVQEKSYILDPAPSVWATMIPIVANRPWKFSQGLLFELQPTDYSVHVLFYYFGSDDIISCSHIPTTLVTGSYFAFRK